MINVYDYFDYRKLLKDLYEEKKKENPRFSYRSLGMKAGFKSAGYFANVLKGKCNISLTAAYRLAEAFKLKKADGEYFELLVMFDLADNQNEKKKYFDKLVAMKRSKLKILGDDQYRLFEAWYYLAIREILDFYRFKDDFRALARMVVPAISPAEAKTAIEVLTSLGLIRKGAHGYYEKVDAVLSTPDRWESQAITFYQYAALDLAKQGFDIWDRKWRDVSTLTLSIGPDDFKQIQAKLSQVQEDILLLAQNSKSTDRVYQINFYSFPLSRIGDRP